MTRDHAYWREKARRVRANNEAESRDSMRVMTPREQMRHRYESWMKKAFPWCDRCEAHGSGFHVCHWCGWEKR